MQLEALSLLIGAVTLVILPMMGFLIRSWLRRLENDVTEAKTSTRADINALGQRLNAFQLDVAEKYVSFERLREVMQPFSDRLDDLKEGQREIFMRLDGKEDKARRGGHD